MYNTYVAKGKKTPPKPTQIINENIPSVDVAKSYLEIELFKFFKKPTKETANIIVTTVRNLKDSRVWALLEAMSFTYHLNGVFYNISRENYTWNEEVYHVNDLVLTGMDSKANKVIFSKGVDGDAIKFKDYLLSYFEGSDESDPEGLLSYKPSNKEIVFEKLLMKENDGMILMLDGSHRLVEMLLSDIDEVTAYVGHPDNADAENNPKYRIGSSTFIMLTIMFKRGNSEEREAVLTLIKQLINTSVDGKKAFKKYWIDRQRDEEIKKAGIEILGDRTELLN